VAATSKKARAATIAPPAPASARFRHRLQQQYLNPALLRRLGATNDSDNASSQNHVGSGTITKGARAACSQEDGGIAISGGGSGGLAP